METATQDAAIPPTPKYGRPHFLINAIEIAVVAALYFVAGKAGLAVPYTSGNVSPVWPAAGFALAVLVMRGVDLWPGIALGAFLVNFFSPVPWIAAVGLAVGNTVGPTCAAVFLRRSGVVKLSGLSHLFSLFQWAILGTAITACVGTAVLFAVGVQPWQDFPQAWLVWWLGDSMGVLLIAPLIMAWRAEWTRTELAEFVVLIVTSATATHWVFSGTHLTEEIFGFAVLPLTIWAALRFGMMGAAIINCVVAGLAVWATAHHVGPFVRNGSALGNAGVLQAFIAAVGVSGLVLAAVVAERRTAQEQLDRHKRSSSMDLLTDHSGDVRMQAVTKFRQGSVLALVILMVSLGATLSAWRLNKKQAFDRTRTRFSQETERTRLSVISRLELYEDGLYATRSFFQANAVDRAAFRNYIANLNLAQRYPGIQGIGYAVRLLPGEVTKHVRSVRSEGFPQYDIHPGGQRPEYTSVVYLEPFDWRNQRAFGFDMLSEPTRRKAMQYARDTGKTSLTAKVRLVQETETDIQPGFLMYLPLYRSGASTGTVEERRAALQGFVYSPFRVTNLMKELIPQGPPLADFELFSGPSPEPDALMYNTSTTIPSSSPAVTQLLSIQFGGEVWSMRFVSSPEFDRRLRDNTNHVLLPAGIAISFLLFGITLSIARTEKRAFRIADNMTERLKESERSILEMNAQLTDALFRSEKLAVTGRLVATVAHEINNPLEALTNLLFVLQSASPSDENWRIFLKQAEDQVAILTNISRQTLSPYRTTTLPVATNICELMDDVLSAFRPRLMTARIQVERRYPPSLEVAIFASELRQVFTNLVANAIDAMVSGGTLTLSIANNSPDVTITIADNGTGISPDKMSSIFEPFYTTKGDKGTGVGMWVVKTIIEKLHGRIDVQSSVTPPHNGTTVTVVVPSQANAKNDDGGNFKLASSA